MNFDILQTFREKIEQQKIEDYALEAAIDPVRSHLNTYFYETKYVNQKSKIFGSFLRGTAVQGLNTLDLLYVLPEHLRLHIAQTDGRGYFWLSDLLDRVFAGSGWVTAPDIQSHSFVVRNASPWPIKLMPVFQLSDELYLTLPISQHDGGVFFRPFLIDAAFRTQNLNSNRNLEILVKTVRYWVATNIVPMSGFLIDCLAMEFMTGSPYRRFSSEYHDCILRDFFRYLSELEPQQESWTIPGANSRVYRTGNFEKQALQAYHLAERMIANTLLRQDGEAKFALRRLVGDVAI